MNSPARHAQRTSPRWHGTTGQTSGQRDGQRIWWKHKSRQCYTKHSLRAVPGHKYLAASSVSSHFLIQFLYINNEWMSSNAMLTLARGYEADLLLVPLPARSYSEHYTISLRQPLGLYVSIMQMGGQLLQLYSYLIFFNLTTLITPCHFHYESFPPQTAGIPSMHIAFMDDRPTWATLDFFRVHPYIFTLFLVHFPCVSQLAASRFLCRR